MRIKLGTNQIICISKPRCLKQTFVAGNTELDFKLLAVSSCPTLQRC